MTPNAKQHLITVKTCLNKIKENDLMDRENDFIKVVVDL
jgi:hypothetical protein